MNVHDFSPRSSPKQLSPRKSEIHIDERKFLINYLQNKNLTEGSEPDPLLDASMRSTKFHDRNKRTIVILF